MKKIWTPFKNAAGKGKLARISGRWKKYSKKKKGIIIAVTVVIVAGGCTGLAILYKNSARPVMASSSSVMEASAETGSISNTIVGTGNLENDTAVSVKIPSGIEIDEVKVESGDQVFAGDVLATVNIASVYTTMEDIQDIIEELDEEINESKDDSDSEDITSKVDGRVKDIYIEDDADISSVMLDKGALMLVSLDGKMAVEVQTSVAAAVDDDVVVTLSDGTEITGNVELVNGKTCVITMSDKKVDVDEAVSVATEDGESMGQGSAYIHQELAVTGTTGTVEDVAVSANEAISSGDTLYTLENNGTSPEYLEQTAKRAAYTNTLTELIALSQSGTITADQDGTIESVLVSDNSESSSSSSSTGSSTGSSAGTSGGVTNMNNSVSSEGVVFMNLSAQTTVEETTPAADSREGEPEGEISGENADTGNETPEIPAADTKLQFAISSSGTSGTENLIIAAPAKGNVPQTEITTQDGCYTGTISWNPAADKFAAATSYQAQVTLTAGTGYAFGADSIVKLETGLLSGVSVSADGKTMTFSLTFPQTASEVTQENENTGGSTDSNSQTTEGTAAGNNSTADGTTAGSTQTQGASQSSGTGSSGSSGMTGSSGASGSSGSSGASTGSSSAGSSSSASTSSDSEASSANEYSTDTTAFTISGNSQMKISVSVDELDINSVSVNQEAEVTFDALEDETFTGKVTKIGNTASVSGGVAKYSVELTVDKTEEMKVGMNASATIVIEQKDDVITIPVNALQERGSEVFVYTEKDEDGNLSGEQTVTTGLSDGDTVEITEGLSEGDTVYYQKTGATSSSSDSGFGNMGGGMGQMGGGSSDRGEMPSGGGSMGTPPGM